MPKEVKSYFICKSCQTKYTRWLGRCDYCDEWNSIVEEKNFKTTSQIENIKIYSVSDFIKTEQKRIQIGIPELDLVFGEGIVQGSLILIAGEPGIGKSTLILEIAKKILYSYKKSKVLYVSGEESPFQITLRAKRIGCLSENLLLLSSVSVENIEQIAKKQNPLLIFIDSVQTIFKEGSFGQVGTIQQLRESTQSLLELSKKINKTIILTGHITKEGNIAGPKILEHLVDTVLYFESDKLGYYRILRAIKNRFGSIGEMALFEMYSKGLKEISNKNQIFIHSLEEKIGSTIGVFSEGTRAFAVEVQALVSKSFYAHSRRMGEGIDNQRIILLAAVLEKYTNIASIGEYDIFINIAGGLKVKDTALDFGICVSIYSSALGKSIPKNTAFIGEVGLSGEIRTVKQIEQKVKELNQIGLKTVLLPYLNKKELNQSYDMNLVFIKNLKEFQEFLN